MLFRSKGIIEVEYTPEDENLTQLRASISFIPRHYEEIVDANNNLIYSTQEEVPFSVHLENSVYLARPFVFWRNQYLLIKNIDELHKANGYFEHDTANNITVWPTGSKVQVLNY